MNRKDLNTSHACSYENDTKILQSEASMPPHSETFAVPATYDSPTINSDNTGSYVQVVVQKHKRNRQFGESERVARASSPMPTLAERTNNPAVRDATTRTDGIRYLGPSCIGIGLNNICSNADGMREAGDARAVPSTLHSDDFDVKNPRPLENNHKEPMWKNLECQTSSLEWEDSGPECLAVYYFERGNGEFLCGTASSHRPLPAVERAIRRAAHRSSWILREFLAPPRLAVALPLYSLIEFERWSLSLIRGVVCGTIQAIGDYFLKPTLAITYNALVRPPLVFLANTTSTLRDGLRPFWQTIADAMEPPAKLLGALRLVQISYVYSAPPSGNFVPV